MATQTAKGRTKATSSVAHQRTSIQEQQRNEIDDEKLTKPLHTVILFPIDYDHPGQVTIALPQHADDVLCSRPHPQVLREPRLNDNGTRTFTQAELPSYFNKNNFQRIQKDLEHDMKDFARSNYYSDTTQEGGGSTRYLHHLAVFMEKLKDRGFNIRYAKDLQTAFRLTREMNHKIQPRSSPYIAKTPKTPKTPTSEESIVSPKKPKKVPSSIVMLIAAPRSAPRILMDARVYDTHIHENVLIMPTHSESRWDYPKIYDLQAFDDIAKKDQSWRPRWHMCDIAPKFEWDLAETKKKVVWPRTPCPFPPEIYTGKRQVLKRGHSCCGYTVATYEWELEPKGPAKKRKAGKKDDKIYADGPACHKTLDLFREFLEMDDRAPVKGNPELNKVKAENTFLHSSRFYHYIHQEYVDSLRSFGEFRVFVATRWINANDEAAGREPYVVDIIRTYFPSDTEKEEHINKLEGTVELAGEEAFPEDGIERCRYLTRNMWVSRLRRPEAKENSPHYEGRPRLTWRYIEKFALSQYRRLHRTFPEHFKSLNVGTRVDVGIGPKDSLFINEITRWWFASWFAGYEDLELQDTVCEAFAKSFSEVFHPAPLDNEDGGDDEDGNEDDDDGDEGGDEEILRELPDDWMPGDRDEAGAGAAAKPKKPKRKQPRKTPATKSKSTKSKSTDDPTTDPQAAKSSKTGRRSKRLADQAAAADEDQPSSPDNDAGQPNNQDDAGNENDNADGDNGQPATKRAKTTKSAGAAMNNQQLQHEVEARHAQGQLDEVNRDNLRRFARLNGIRATGNKADVVARIRTHLGNADDDDDA